MSQTLNPLARHRQPISTVKQKWAMMLEEITVTEWLRIHAIVETKSIHVADLQRALESGNVEFELVA